MNPVEKHDNPTPLLLRLADDRDTGRPECRDDVTLDDPIPWVAGNPASFANFTRETKVFGETTDDN